MTGDRRAREDALFYEFSLERRVPERHLLRSIDPELLIRMLIVGFGDEEVRAAEPRPLTLSLITGHVRLRRKIRTNRHLGFP